MIIGTKFQANYTKKIERDSKNLSLFFWCYIASYRRLFPRRRRGNNPVLHAPKKRVAALRAATRFLGAAYDKALAYI